MTHPPTSEKTTSEMTTFQMTFEGRPVPAAPGQSVGAALAAAGITSWRTTRLKGRPRGLFCGIGVCYDCLITVDGTPGQRACLVPARDGMRLTGDAPVPGDALVPGDVLVPGDALVPADADEAVDTHEAGATHE